MKTYILTMSNSNLVKVGKSKRIEDRLFQHQTSNPFISDSLIFNGDYESYIHRCLDRFRIKGEWFDLSEFITNEWNVLDISKDLFKDLIIHRDYFDNDCEAIEYLSNNGIIQIKNPHRLK